MNGTLGDSLSLLMYALTYPFMPLKIDACVTIVYHLSSPLECSLHESMGLVSRVHH